MATDTAAAVPQSLFSVDDCPPEQRFEFWRHSIAAIFDVDAKREVIDDFHATIDSHLVGPLMLARTCTRQQHWVRSSQTIARDGMDHYMIQLFENGGQTVRTGGLSRSMSAGQLIVCDLQRTMDNETTDFQNLSILIPRSLLAPELECPDAVHNLIIDPALPLGRILREHLMTLKEAAGGLAAGDVQAVTEATVKLVAACVDGVGRAARGKPVAPLPPLLSRIKRYILDNLRDPMLGPETIVSQQGVSRTRLYEMFEPEGGVFAYIRAMRLKAAFDALRDPRQASRSVYDIALEAGYRSDAAFCRAFKSTFEATPSMVRASAVIVAEADARQAFGIDRSYEAWLRNLCRIDRKRGTAQIAAGSRVELMPYG